MEVESKKDLLMMHKKPSVGRLGMMVRRVTDVGVTTSHTQTIVVPHIEQVKHYQQGE